MKYNIALFGTFDVENYGDLMFPEIFAKAMGLRLEKFELFLFSPWAQKKKALDESTVVYPVSDVAKIHKENPLSVVVIGGGALIHYSKIAIKKPKCDKVYDYRILDSWFYPIDFAVRNNIKVVFNLPQVPYEIPKNMERLTCEAINSLSYVSVRDAVSKTFLEDAYKNCGLAAPEIDVFPDSVCIISELFPSLERLDLPEKYAVLQFNPQKPDGDDDIINKCVLLLKQYGIEVVLLPLGYTHNDDGVLSEFNRKFNNPCKMFDRKLNIFEMASVLAGSQIYIGSSFHGAITATAYGKAAISYNYIYPKNKNREIFRMYGTDDFVAETASQVYEILSAYLNGGKTYTPKITQVNCAVNGHFDRLAEIIKSDGFDGYGDNGLINAELDLFSECNRFKDEINSRNDIISQKENLIIKLQNEVAERNELLMAANNCIAEMRNSFFWRITLPTRKISGKLKLIIFKSRTLVRVYKGIKMLLLQGPKAVYRQLKTTTANKYKGKAKIGKDIKSKRRDYENSYKFEKNVKFSILVPLYNTPEDLLKEMIKSVKCQTYSNWELCLADGSTDEFSYVGEYCKQSAKKDNRIKYKKLEENKGISENTNVCIEMSSGDYIALFDHDDLLHSSALFEYAKVICEENADFIYCDEDKFEKVGGRLFDPHFKPDFSPDMLRSVNYICHFTVFDRKLLEKVGKFKKEFDGSQDHDIILRLTEKAGNIVHIPKILYHWRVSGASVASDPYAKPYTIKAGKDAVAEHLERVGLKGCVESTEIHPNYYRVKYELISKPMVSIIIPNNNQIQALSRCIESIIEKSTYGNYEIIIVENNSNEETFEYYKTLEKYPQIKVVVFKPQDGFNFSQLNNYGVKFAKGEQILLLNNDVEIISENWLEEMLMFSQRKDIGAVGALLLYPNDTVQHAGVILGIGGVAGHAFKYFPADSAGYFGRLAYQQNYSAVTAACLMMKRSVYDEVGGLDEKYKVAFNDVDLCMRIRKAGYLIAYTPFAKLYHHESISRGSEDTPEKRARFTSEVNRFLEQWGKELEAGDPYYNPNLTLESEDFAYKY